MSSSPSAPHWRSAPRAAIVWREWGGEVVVRNERSGSTHLLGPLAGSVLRVLLESVEVLSAAEIGARVNDTRDSADDTAGQAAIEEVLSEFERLGLADPVSR